MPNTVQPMGSSSEIHVEQRGIEPPMPDMAELDKITDCPVPPEPTISSSNDATQKLILEESQRPPAENSSGAVVNDSSDEEQHEPASSNDASFRI